MGRVKGLAKIEASGRITIPVDMLESLGWKKGDHLGLVVEGGELRVLKGTITELTAGLLYTPGVSLTVEEMQESAESAIAEEVMRRGRS